jgi:hypothetical protein
MMDQSINSVLQNINISDIAAYLRLKGWRQVAPYNKRFLVFQGYGDNEGHPLEIALPVDNNSTEKDMYIESSINLLCALNEDTPEHIIQQIKFYEYDLLYIRNFDTQGFNSIEVSIAATQAVQMNHLFIYAICSEYRPKPYFYNPSKRAYETIKNFRFGHTFPGSFGYNIQSRVRDQQQLSLSSQSEKSDMPESRAYIRLPIERRVMERVARGLLSIPRALRSNNSNVLVNDYPQGLNSNMCRALLNMSPHWRTPIEYRVSWSPKIEPSTDIHMIDPIIIDEDGCKFLQEAIKKLNDFEPEETTVIGHVTGFTAKSDPLASDETPRLVTIKWENREGRAIDIGMVLKKQDYIQATEAHLAWQKVSVSGAIMKMGNGWELSSPYDFYILPSDIQESNTSSQYPLPI